MIRIVVMLIISCFSTSAMAQGTKIKELKLWCDELQKGAIGKKFDQVAAARCNAYMGSFFDTMIIFDKVAGDKQFCIPPSIPTTYNTHIINEWVKKNERLAEDSTAAVALYGAFKRAFPCKKSK